MVASFRRTIALLQDFMDRERRDTWLTQAFSLLSNALATTSIRAARSQRQFAGVVSKTGSMQIWPGF
jgi:hypothetical protein